MTVVSNASPLNYLILIGAARLLPQLFERLYLPAAVRHELRDAAAADSVRAWVESPPVWVQVRQVTGAALPARVELHPGTNCVKATSFYRLIVRSCPAD